MHLPQCFDFTAPQLPAYLAMGTLAGVCAAGVVILRKREFHGRPFFLIGYVATMGWLTLVLMELLAAAPSCSGAGTRAHPCGPTTAAGIQANPTQAEGDRPSACQKAELTPHETKEEL